MLCIRVCNLLELGLALIGLWRDRLTEIIEASFEKSIKGKWIVTDNHPMFTEVRERIRTASDNKYADGELRVVVEAKYPSLKLDRLIVEGHVKERGLMVYLPRHEISKQDIYNEKCSGTRKKEITDGEFNELSAGIDSMLAETSEMLPVQPPEQVHWNPWLWGRYIKD